MEELEEELKKELTQFVYQHAWSSGCQTTANYTGFHMINVFLEKLQKTTSNSEYKQCNHTWKQQLNTSDIIFKCVKCGSIKK